MLRYPEKVHYKTGRKPPSRHRLLDPLWEGTRERHSVLQTKSSPTAPSHQSVLDVWSLAWAAAATAAAGCYKELRETATGQVQRWSQQCRGSCGKLQRKRCCRKEVESFQVDLRVHGVSQDVIYKDEERTTKIQTLVDGLQDGYRTKSIIKDLKQERCIQSVQWRIKTCGKGEGEHWVHTKFGQTTRKIQCPSCWKYSKERTVLLLMWNMTYVFRWKKLKILRIELSSSQISPYVIAQGKSGERHGHWRVAVPSLEKPERPPRMFRKECTQPSRRDGKKT